MKNYIAKNYTNIVAYLIALLFVYAAISKTIDFENFQVQLAQSPLLSAYAGFISYSVIIIELALALLLCLPKYQKFALYGSLGLMSAFTIYIYLILNYSDFVPCSCGGILEDLGWTEHLIFNIVFVILAFTAILYREKKSNPVKSLAFPFSISLATIICSIGTVIALFLSSEHIIKKENNFTRRFLMHPIIEDKKINLDNENYYFVGNDEVKIYLGNKSYPQTLFSIDTAFTDSVRIKIQPDNLSHTFRNIQIKVKSPYYYFYDGSVPVIYRGKLGDQNAKTISFNDAFFTQFVPIDSTKFALRTLSRKTKELTLALLDINADPKIKLYPTILEKQVDGVFDVDGGLISNNNTEDLVYIYNYRNQFISLDNKLNVLRRLNTIDTTTHVKIQTTVMKDGRHKFSAPPFKVNSRTIANRNLLFIQSDLMGKHESRESWKRAKIIDVYKANGQEYLGSFYLYKGKDSNVTDFWATDNFLFVLIGSDLKRFYFREPIIGHFKNKEGKTENL
ncbi:tellurium resistance protein TerC [Chryseobacterium indologenes]|uniref:MauE/DoxX family redox-associated membrane protein n=1 Tax=Chryseobacterium indologenes TaxID=253 RepID=UPI000B51C3C0|nr:MauE/DoxX family redox-associated membrane protein [Chryseobacterium indologenes]ASE62027.1 tellurium resistance protein TerC [Chryseobacterium indologenes]